MKQIRCTNCQRDILLNDSAQDTVFCTYCGSKINLSGSELQQEIALEEAVTLLLKEKDPIVIHDKLMTLRSAHPESLVVHRAILMQGRLHERNPKKLDYSVIHCYLLNIFLEPEIFNAEQKEAYCAELTQGKNLVACLALAKDKAQFLRQYYIDLSQRFIELFLLGSSKHMRTFFGLTMSRNPAKTLACPAAVMLRGILACTALGEQQLPLANAFYTAFAQKFDSISYLDEELGQDLLKIKAPL